MLTWCILVVKSFDSLHTRVCMRQELSTFVKCRF